MSSLFEIRIDSKSTEFDSYSCQESYQEENQKKFLTKKRGRKKKKEIFEAKNDGPEKYEEELFPKENLKSFIKKGERKYDNSTFIKKKFNNPFKLIKPEVDSFPKAKVASEVQLNFDLSLQEESEDNYLLPLHPMMDNNPMPSLKDIRDIFFPDNILNESDSISFEEPSNLLTFRKSKPVEEEEEKYLYKRRRGKRKQRKYNADNIRTKIKRSFLRYLRKKLNKILKNSGSKKFFDFFPYKFSGNVNKEENKKILKMTLEDIFLDKNLFKSEDKDGKEKYERNSDVVKSGEIKNNQAIQNILNKAFQQLYEDYINSDEFNVDEINRLKRDKKEEDFYYIERYKMIAKNLIIFYSKEN